MTTEVLVVDEDSEVLELTATFLEREGLAVSTETDPERALERLTEGEFDAVVSDLTMPGMDGLELCDQLRSRGQDVPFVIFTGKDEEAVADPGDVTAFVRKETGTDQYGQIASAIRGATA